MRKDEGQTVDNNLQRNRDSFYSIRNDKDSYFYKLQCCSVAVFLVLTLLITTFQQYDYNLRHKRQKINTKFNFYKDIFYIQLTTALI